jgi:(p)ppGpp synthase/HD superfamily hydrolase
MDESLYRGFDERAHAFFAQLKASTDRKSPNRMTLKRLFIAEVRRALPFLTESDFSALRRSFNIAFFAYYDVERRDGEAYIFHVVRSTLVLIWAFGRFKVFDLACCHVVFQHDSYEEANDTWFSQTLIRSIVRFRLGKEVATDVAHLTQEENESDTEYMVRLLTLAGWRSHLGKGVERTDNIWTLDKDDAERSKRKLRETREWFVRIEERLMEHIAAECEAGRLEQVWLEVARFLMGYLWYAVEIKEREFNGP